MSDYAILGEFNFQPATIDEESLATAASEEPFTQAAFELLKELGLSVGVIAGIQRVDAGGQPRAMTRDEAILAGLMVRATKLLMGLLDAMVAHRDTLANLHVRAVIEAAVNLRYLIEKDDPKLYQRFVTASFRADRDVLEAIEHKRAVRASQELPEDLETALSAAEKRITEQIQEKLSASDVDMDEVPAGHGDWAGGVRQRFEAIASTTEYLGFFAGPSAWTHGTWHELESYHLRQVDGGVEPDLLFGSVRPQIPLVVCDQLARAALAYLDIAGPAGPDASTVAQRLDATLNRAERIQLKHELWLAARAS